MEMNQTKQSEEWIQQVWGQCLKGDVKEAYHLLKNKKDLQPEWEKLSEDMYERFFAESPKNPNPPISHNLKQILECYYTYFRHVLLRKTDRVTAEETLATDLSIVLGKPNKPQMEQLEKEIQQLFELEGYNFLGGKTAPFFGPYIWKTNEAKEFEVELPLGKRTLKVIFMSDFVMKGWFDFASCGRRGAGGWAKEEALYCVYESYKDILETPKFQVSYLKHEAQHADDYERFPYLKSYELEYRAKLVEIMNEDTPRLLHQILRDMDRNPDFPHNYSSYLIYQEFEKRLGYSFTIDTDFTPDLIHTIKELAEMMFFEHTETLIK